MNRRDTVTARLALRAAAGPLGACASPSHVDAGCLRSCRAGGELPEAIARSVDDVDRIRRGARPADLPVIRPERYELVINPRTARALGLQVPRSVPLRAARSIE